MALARETVAFLESGCVLIVGTVMPDGEPHAARGWGLTVLDEECEQVRLLLDADECATLANLAANGVIAITGACVRTLRSTQLKGRASLVEPPTLADEERAERFVDDMKTVINAVDGTPVEHLERMRPVGYVACTVEIEELYDQTPGPGAGAPIEMSS